MMTTPGTVAAGGVGGVEVYDLANGGKNILTLVSGNFTGVTGSLITVNDGNAGNTVSASGVTGARCHRRPCWRRRRYPDRRPRKRRVLRGRQHKDDGRGWHEPVHLQRRGQQHDRRFHRIDHERDRVQQYRIRPRPQRRYHTAGAPRPACSSPTAPAPSPPPRSASPMARATASYFIPPPAPPPPSIW